LRHIAHGDEGGPKDENRRSTWSRTVLGMQDRRMSPTLPVAKGIATSLLSSICRTHTRRMESTIKMFDPDVEDDNWSRSRKRRDECRKTI
jgi:hypothetical protein